MTADTTEAGGWTRIGVSLPRRLRALMARQNGGHLRRPYMPVGAYDEAHDLDPAEMAA